MRLTVHREESGFTLIEMMIVVVIIAVLAAVAIVAYTRHVKTSRMNAERAFVSSIQALEETYFQRFGVYFDVSEDGTSVGALYPAGSSKFEAHEWKPDPGNDNHTGWMHLGAKPKQNVTYFQWRVEASTSSNGHARYGNAQLYGVPAQPTGTPTPTPHPWYYVEGIADMDSSAADNTTLFGSSGRNDIGTLNEGK